MDFGSDKISTLFGKLFFPTLAGMLSLCAVTAADGIFIGHGIGGDGIASIALSKGKIKRARFNLTQSMIFVTAVMMFFVALIMLFPEKTARLLGASDHLLKKVVDYLLWFVPGLIFQMWGAVALFYIRLDGAPKWAMWCNVVPAALNVALDWLFIFPFGWGVMGAAFASALSMAAGVSSVLGKHFDTMPYRIVRFAGGKHDGDADVRRQPSVYAVFG